MNLAETLTELQKWGLLSRTLALKVSSDGVEVRLQPALEVGKEMTQKEIEELQEKVMFLASAGQG